MKSVLVAFLLFAVVLFVTAEAKRRGKGGPGGKPWKNKIKSIKGELKTCAKKKIMSVATESLVKYYIFGIFELFLLLRLIWFYSLFCCTDLKCPRNCSDCEEGMCLACDDDFALKTLRFNNKSICVPCGRRLKMKDPALFLQQCITSKFKTVFSIKHNLRKIQYIDLRVRQRNHIL